MKKHIIIAIFVVLGLYFLPKTYPIYLEHVEFPRVRSNVSPPWAVYGSGEYTSLLPDRQPKDYALVAVTRHVNGVTERYYHRDGTIYEQEICGGEFYTSTTRYRGTMFRMLPGELAFVWMFIVIIIRTVRTREVFTWQIKWSNNTPFETYSFAYGGIVFVVTMLIH